FVSGVAVLVSLVYLATQVRQATKNARSAIAQGRITRLGGVQPRMAEGSAGEIFARGRRGDETLTPAELARFMAFARAQFWSSEDNFLQHRDGMLSDEMFTSFRASNVGLMRGAGMQAAWEMHRLNFVPEFTAFMDGVARDAMIAGFFEVGAAQWRDVVARIREKEKG